MADKNMRNAPVLKSQMVTLVRIGREPVVLSKMVGRLPLDYGAGEHAGSETHAERQRFHREE
jgi:hypothetical protein